MRVKCDLYVRSAVESDEVYNFLCGGFVISVISDFLQLLVATHYQKLGTKNAQFQA